MNRAQRRLLNKSNGISSKADKQVKVREWCRSDLTLEVHQHFEAVLKQYRGALINDATLTMEAQGSIARILFIYPHPEQQGSFCVHCALSGKLGLIADRINEAPMFMREHIPEGLPPETVCLWFTVNPPENGQIAGVVGMITDRKGISAWFRLTPDEINMLPMDDDVSSHLFTALNDYARWEHVSALEETAENLHTTLQLPDASLPCIQAALRQFAVQVLNTVENEKHLYATSVFGVWNALKDRALEEIKSSISEHEKKRVKWERGMRSENERLNKLSNAASEQNRRLRIELANLRKSGVTDNARTESLDMASALDGLYADMTNP